MKKLVAYLDGTNPLWLTTLQLMGRDTLPMSNGYDSHGMNIQLITPGSKPDVILCWLHKLIWPGPEAITPRQLLHNTMVYSIPVLVVCPQAYHQQVTAVVGDMPENVRLVDPSELLEAAIKATE